MTFNKDQFFCTTKWTLVANAGDPYHPRVQKAFAELYGLYSGPIYSYFRRAGYDSQEAEDLVQTFFQYAYENKTLAKAERNRGRFRTFIRACLVNFLRDKHRRNTAIKRGAGLQPFSFDGLKEEQRYAAEPVDDLSPDKLFQRKLALEIFRKVIKELESELVNEGKGELFSALRRCLGKEGESESYQDLSIRLNMPVGTLKSHASRFRKRAREILEEHIRQLVSSEEEVSAEIIALENEL